MIEDSIYNQARNFLKGSHVENALADANNLLDFNTQEMLVLHEDKGKTNCEESFRVNTNEMLLVHRLVSKRFDKKSLTTYTSTKTEIFDIEKGTCLSFKKAHKGKGVEMSEKNLNRSVAHYHTRLFDDLVKRKKTGEAPRSLPAKQFKLEFANLRPCA